MNEEAKQFVLSICNNNIRILVNYLEKFKLINQFIDKQLAIELCTNINFNDFEIFTEYCLNNNIQDAIKILYNIFDMGYSVMDILDNYFLFIKNVSKLNENIKYKIIKLLCKYITIFHIIHEDEIELALFTNNLVKLLNEK
jgi:DNA polymerase III gamma/tau subunit